MKRAGDKILLDRPVVVDFIIQADAPFTGREIRSLGLPAGCILVRCSDGKARMGSESQHPPGSAYADHAVIAPEASNGLEILRQGCGSPKKKKNNSS